VTRAVASSRPTGVSEKRMREMFDAIDAAIRKHPEVGEYNQKI
jgi:phosphomannomutase/phosphoglucomutase